MEKISRADSGYKRIDLCCADKDHLVKIKKTTN
jgi:hypothetical protein